ncbi:MAG: hypothetical protein ACE5EO_08335 [Candidatus Krumholzibacteriia bacterium]
MDKQIGQARVVTLFVLLLLAAGVYLLWSHNQEAIETSASAPVKQLQARMGTVKKARSLKVTFDNPEMGLCPVCGQGVNYESFASVGYKKYAMCSDACAEKLLANPQGYLGADAQP